MVVGTFSFTLFLASVFLAHSLLQSDTHKKLLLLFASYYFYSTWDFRFTALLAAMTLCQWLLGHAIAMSSTRRRRKALLTTSIAVGIGTLAYFKYLDFFLDSTKTLLSSAGIHVPDAVLAVAMPVGISFYVFQLLSYTLDVAAKRIEPEQSLLSFSLFASFFPQLTSGPISRASDLLPQINSKDSARPRKYDAAVYLIMRGITKKVVFADVLATHFVTPAFQSPAAWSSAFLWTSVIAYSLQIYMDLSGYTDIARGSAKLFGYELAVNFRRPYNAVSVSQFWQRWHISMSSFFRDYVYFSMGGTKRGNVYINILLTFLAIGLWHGAGVTFLIYGVLHGTAVCIERVFRSRYRAKTGRDPEFEGFAAAWRVAAVFLFVALARILFLSASPAETGAYLQGMFHSTSEVWGAGAQGVASLIVAGALHYTPERWQENAQKYFWRFPMLIRSTLMVGWLLCVIVLAPAPQPFVYFQF